MKITVINSKGHWQNGWASTPQILNVLVDSFARNNIEVNIHDVCELAELESVLENTDANSLILPNAYYVNRFKGSKNLVWIGEVIKNYQRPYIGSGSQTLRNLLQKDSCQRILKANGVRVPEFAVVNQSDLGQEREILAKSEVTFPAIVKPTNLSCSCGISQDSIVHNEKEAIAQIRMLIKTYQANVIIEEFLASDDITVSYLPGNGRTPKILATYYRIKSKPGLTSVIGRAEAKLNWGESRELTPVKDENLLHQFEEIIPNICNILNVRDITRIDGRLDKDGNFSVFDVNAYPGLCPDISTQTAQCEVIFPDLPKLVIYDALVNTILLSASHRYKIPTPQIVREHNLFTIGAPVSTIPAYENSIL